LKPLSDEISQTSETSVGVGTDLDIDSNDMNNQALKYQLERFGSDTHDRRWLAKWTAWTITGWLFAVMFAVLFNEKFTFHISDSVLLMLLGTTTLNVLSLSLIVLRGHFYKA